MLIEMGNVWARVAQATKPELDFLGEYLSYEDTRYDPRAVGSWDRTLGKPRRSMLDPFTRRFPAGLAIGLRKPLKEAGIDLQVNDLRVVPCRADQDQKLYPWLRPYQASALEDVMRRGGRGLIKAPTGSGKTELIVALTRVYPCEWLSVVHRADLVEQTALRFNKRTGERAGVFAGGKWIRGTSNLTVSTFQAIAAAQRKKAPGLRELLAGIEAFDVDEVHSQPADSFYRVSLALENAYYRIGQSGTPLDRGDFAALRTIGALGPMLAEVPIAPLIADGTLAKPTIRMARCRQGSAKEVEWTQVYRDLVVGSKERNDVVAWMAEQAEKPCMLFVDELAHGDALRRELAARGLKASFVAGGDSLDNRKRKVKELIDGGDDVLICTVIFQEGIDVPELRSVVVATGKSSIVACLQRIGRGMRTCAAAGKTTFEVWDVLDHGQAWLEEHARTRLQTYEREGHLVEVIKT